MKLRAVTKNGVIGVWAYTREGLFVSQEPVEFLFDNDEQVLVPGGFVFDGASIPPWARSLITSLTTAANVAFILHDYAYARGAALLRSGEPVEISREHADWIALALCTWLELDYNDQLEIYYALRVAGGSSFQRFPVTRTIRDLLEARG